MNFFDFELSRNATATPPQSSGQEGTSEPSLNEEVSQVVGQLGKLWGGFRKQVCFLSFGLCVMSSSLGVLS